MTTTLREWRTRRLWSVRDLAREANVSTKTIVQVELGRQRPSYGTMRRICAALDIDSSEITEFADTLAERSKDAA